MSHSPALEIPVPETSPDDIVLPFQVEALELRGRVVRLGPAVDSIIAQHAYPAPVSQALGEATALTLLLASSLKFDGRLILQTQTDGPLRMIVVDVATPDKVRALARFDADKVASAMSEGRAGIADLIGQGQLVMTIDQGPAMERYQGVVALEGQGLEKAADQYFRQSEQIPTKVRLGAAEELVAGAEGIRRGWRAGGVMVQHLPADGGRPVDLDPGDAPPGAETPVEAEPWVAARALAETIGVDELVDSRLSPERLLYRLFHEQGVRVFPTMAVRRHCTCSREKIVSLIQSFTPAERADMVEDGAISVTCEYCSTTYRFAPTDFD